MKFTRNSLNQIITEELTKLILEMKRDMLNPDDYNCSDPQDRSGLGYKSEEDCRANIENDLEGPSNNAGDYNQLPTNKGDLSGVMQMLQQIDTKLSTLLSAKKQR